MSRGTEAEAGSEATEPERRWPGQSRARFAELHRSGCFVIPNPWDVGSARLLEGLGFQALATTSAGLAQSLGKRDQEVTLDELAAILGQELELPRIEPKGKKKFEAYDRKYTGIRPVGPNSLRNFKRTFKQANF